MTNCPCGSSQSYQTCCGQYIEDKKAAETPEALMRSRYTAFTQANTAYIEATMGPPANEHFNAEESAEWAKSITWEKLEILNSVIKENIGYVEFIANFRINDKKQKIHEISEFQKKNGKWIYVKGVAPSVSTFVNEHKTGRNDPCSCGSGKKFKKCCLKVQ